MQSHRIKTIFAPDRQEIPEPLRSSLGGIFIAVESSKSEAACAGTQYEKRAAEAKAEGLMLAASIICSGCDEHEVSAFNLRDRHKAQALYRAWTARRYAPSA
jgi:hypothetical protein